MASSRFRSGGKIYELTAIDEITPRDLLTFPRDASEVMARPIRWIDVEHIFDELKQLPEGQQDTHPDFDFFMTVLVWVSRRAAGDKLTYGECLDEPFSMIPDPEDHKPNPRKAAGKKKSGSRASRAADQGSATGAVEAPGSASTTPATSESGSSPE